MFFLNYICMYFLNYIYSLSLLKRYWFFYKYHVEYSIILYKFIEHNELIRKLHFKSKFIDFCARFVIGQYVTVHGDVISHVNISHVMVEDGGEYSCTAENRAGKVTHAARLNVYGAYLPLIIIVYNVRQIVINFTQCSRTKTDHRDMWLASRFLISSTRINN